MQADQPKDDLDPLVKKMKDVGDHFFFGCKMPKTRFWQNGQVEGFGVYFQGVQF